MKHSFWKEENLKDQFLLIWKDTKGDLPAAVNIVFVHRIRKGERSQIIDFCDFYTARKIVDRFCHLKGIGGSKELDFYHSCDT